MSVLSSHPAVGVLGASCRLPGAETLAEFWRMSAEGGVGLGEIPGDRLTTWAQQPPGVTRGGFLLDVWAFDAPHFGISTAEAEYMDVQQRLVAQAAWHALEDAGIVPGDLAGQRVGVYVGQATHDYALLTQARRSLPSPYLNTGMSGAVTANRLSYLWDLRGPSLSIDTACSSSLVALHAAWRALRDDECDLAIVAGVNALVSPIAQQGAAALTALSPSGRCRPLDASADGYVRAEGVGVVILGRVLDHPGGMCRATIMGSAVNQDGRTNGLTAPSGSAQADVISAAHRAAGIHRDDLGYVELHGTGTPLGDPIEAKALSAVIAGRTEPLHVGSAKGNIGHAEAAAGLVGLVRALGVLDHGSIHPQAGFEEPNPRIELSRLGLAVATDLEPLPPGTVGVSSFGFGGTNAHVVLGPPAGARSHRQSTPGPAERVGAVGQEVVVVSASSPRSLEAALQEHRRTLQVLPVDRWGSYAAAAAHARSHLPFRVAAAAADPAAAAEALERAAVPHEALGGSARIAFVYSGHGSQWCGMGREWLLGSQVFVEAVDEIADGFTRAGGPGIASLMRRHVEADLEDAAVAQPLIFAVQIALTRLLTSWGVKPLAVVGHSVGEVAAAVVSGELSLAEGCAVVVARNAVVATTPGLGGMVSLECTRERASEVLTSYPGLDLAVVNGPRSVLLSGPDPELDALLADSLDSDLSARRVRVGYPSHSRYMGAASTLLEDDLGELDPMPGAIRRYSTVEGEGDDTRPDASYWARNLRRGVNFARAIGRATSDGVTHLVEVSPHPLLLDAMRDGVSTATATWTGDREAPHLPAMLARLFEAGLPLDPSATHPGNYEAQDVRRLPLYAFDNLQFHPPLGAPRDNLGHSPHPALDVPPVSPGHRVHGEDTLSAGGCAWLVLSAAVDGSSFASTTARVSRLRLEAPVTLGGGPQPVVDLLAGRVAVGGRVVMRFASAQPTSEDRHPVRAEQAEPMGGSMPGEIVDIDAVLGQLADAGVELGIDARDISQVTVTALSGDATAVVPDGGDVVRWVLDTAVNAAAIGLAARQLATQGTVRPGPVTGIDLVEVHPAAADLRPGADVQVAWSATAADQVSWVSVRAGTRPVAALHGLDLVPPPDVAAPRSDGVGVIELPRQRRSHASVQAALTEALTACLPALPASMSLESTAFVDLGLDSIRAAEVRRRLEDELGMRIPLVSFWRHPTPGEFVAAFAGAHHAVIAGDGESPTATDTLAEGTASESASPPSDTDALTELRSLLAREEEH
ncbi:acyltransferase domain-containing protein [Nocardioides rotundus]|uniref:type I polyketide synthase n=1 Tax=Nocardioides rotundus TaxID=1774216 RepID=UPI002958877B|nr:beta-ketoacyl synthase N-terminal-like domain-containing protein [Nocardioides rotundus]UAL31479.1 acyltransferase domain-containing protein [Nocardioides rotundus]